MSEEIEIMYLNLKHLLDDICTFLKDEINKNTLSQESRKHADNLIRRSRIQLQKISNLPIDTGYMDMQNKIFNGASTKSDSNESQISMTPPTPSMKEHNNSYPHLEIPAKNLPKDEKCGYLSWKTKIFFGFEKMRKYYAGIYDVWLLIYHNEKDSKPFFLFDLRKNRAQKVVNNKQSEIETQYFCIIDSETEGMNQFLAKNHKDMLQWVTKINKCHEKSQKYVPHIENSEDIIGISMEVTENNISPNENEGDDTYDVIIVENEKKNHTVRTEEIIQDDEEVYIDIEYKPEPQPQRPVEHAKSRKSPINPPVRLQQTPLPPLPKENRDSQVSYDNPIIIGTDSNINQTTASEEDDEFSANESEEDIYDEVVTLPAEFGEKTKPVVMPKPPLLTKPKIDFKITKPSPNGKPSTKEILKLAKEKSLQ